LALSLKKGLGVQHAGKRDRKHAKERKERKRKTERGKPYLRLSMNFGED